MRHARGGCRGFRDQRIARSVQDLRHRGGGGRGAAALKFLGWGKPRAVMTDLAIRQGGLSRVWAPADDRPRGLGTWVLLNLLVCAAYSVAGLVVLLFGIGPAKIS